MTTEKLLFLWRSAEGSGLPGAKDDVNGDQEKPDQERIGKAFTQNDCTQQSGGDRLERVKGGAGAGGEHWQTFYPGVLCQTGASKAQI